MNNAYFQLCLKYIFFVLCTSTLFWLYCVSNVQAGIVGEIGDIGFKIAVINIWKGLGGLALFLGGCYMMHNRRPFRYKIMAFAVAFMLISMTIIGMLLFLAEFWPVISGAAKSAAEFIKKIFSS